MTTHRAELRARYPVILERASLSYGPGWAGLMEALCERLQFHADHNTMPPVEITQPKEKWGELTNDDWDVIAGKRDQLAGRIQERYGRTKEEAEKEVDEWLNNQ